MNRICIFGAILALCLGLCGCGRTDESVDVRAFASADDNVLISCDFRLVADLADIAEGENLAGARLLASIDTASLADGPALFKASDDYALAFLSLKDRKAFAKSVEGASGCSPEKDGRFDVYNIGDGRKVLVTNGFACFALSGGSADQIDSLIFYAMAHPLEGWRMDALHQGNLISAVCDIPQNSFAAGLYESQPAAFVLSANASEGRFTADASVRDAAGKPMRMTVKERIDTSLLQYATPRADVVALVAVPGELNWPALFAGTDFATFAPVLAKTDGTQMVSYNTRTRNFGAAFQLTPKAADKEMVYGEFYGIRRVGNTLLFGQQPGQEGGVELPGLGDKDYMAYVWAQCSNGPLNINGELWFDGCLLYADFTGKDPLRMLRVLSEFFL